MDSQSKPAVVPGGFSELLQAARANSPDAVGHLLESFRPYLLGIANQEIFPGARRGVAASDIVQDTLLEAHRDFAAFFGRGDRDFRGWLRQMLRHNLVDLVRRHQGAAKCGARQPALVGEAASEWQALAGIPANEPTPSTWAMAKEKSRQLQETLFRLPPDYRTIIVLRYQQGLSFEEAAVRMDRSVDAVRKLWLRGIQRLRQLLEEPKFFDVAR